MSLSSTLTLSVLQIRLTEEDEVDLTSNWCKSSAEKRKQYTKNVNQKKFLQSIDLIHNVLASKRGFDPLILISAQSV